jgi:hypothetical protein
MRGYLAPGAEMLQWSDIWISAVYFFIPAILITAREPGKYSGAWQPS